MGKFQTSSKKSPYYLDERFAISCVRIWNDLALVDSGSRTYISTHAIIFFAHAVKA